MSGVLLASAALAMTVGTTALSSVSNSASELIPGCRSWLMLDEHPWHMLVLGLNVLGVTVIWRGVRSALSTHRSTRRLRRSLRTCGELAIAQAQVIDDPAPFAFCAGLLRPRVYVSTEAVARLNAAELRAVLDHEAHHAKRHDPLRLLVARALSDALFFVPARRRVLWRHATLAEIDADRAAIRASGNPKSLASAMLILGEVKSSLTVSVANERVDHLAGKSLGWRAPMSPLLSAALTLFSFGGLAVASDRATGLFEASAPTLAMQSCGPLMLVGAMLLSLWAIRLVQTPARSRNPDSYYVS